MELAGRVGSSFPHHVDPGSKVDDGRDPVQGVVPVGFRADVDDEAGIRVGAMVGGAHLLVRAPEGRDERASDESAGAGDEGRSRHDRSGGR